MTTHSGPGVSTGRDQGAGEPVLTPRPVPWGLRELLIKALTSAQTSQACPSGSWSRVLIWARLAALGWRTLASLGTARRQR